MKKTIETNEGEEFVITVCIDNNCLVALHRALHCGAQPDFETGEFKINKYRWDSMSPGERSHIQSFANGFIAGWTAT